MLRLTMPGNVMTSLMTPPIVTLDGQLLNVPKSWGTFDFPVQAGNHHLHAHAQLLKTFGNADIDFSIQPGQLVEIFYAAPAHQLASRGNIGFTPQKKPGMGAMIGVMIALAVVIIALIAVLMMLPIIYL